jgi:dynein heavy chain
VFRKLLLIRSWSPDRTLSQAKKYIRKSLGNDYGEAKILDLEVTWSESEPRTPLVCILSIGSDPSPLITSLAKQKTIRKYHCNHDHATYFPSLFPLFKGILILSLLYFINV